MKVLSSGVSVGLVVAVASLLVPASSKVLAKDVLEIGQAPSVSNFCWLSPVLILRCFWS